MKKNILQTDLILWQFIKTSIEPISSQNTGTKQKSLKVKITVQILVAQFCVAMTF